MGSAVGGPIFVGMYFFVPFFFGPRPLLAFVLLSGDNRAADRPLSPRERARERERERASPLRSTSCRCLCECCEGSLICQAASPVFCFSFVSFVQRTAAARGSRYAASETWQCVCASGFEAKHASR